MKQVSVRFSDQEHSGLVGLSVMLDRSINDLVREAARMTLEAHGLKFQEKEIPVSEYKTTKLPRSISKDDFKPPQTRYELKLLLELQKLKLKCEHNVKLHGFYPDIFLPEYNLVIEVDGKIHDFQKRKVHDQNRTKVFKEKGIKVIRFTNRQISKNMKQCLAEVKHHVYGRSKPSAPEPEEKPKSKRRLTLNSDWEALACKKLGIDTAKPKSNPINAQPEMFRSLSRREAKAGRSEAFAQVLDAWEENRRSFVK